MMESGKCLIIKVITAAKVTSVLHFSFFVEYLDTRRVPLLLLDCCGCSFNVGVVLPFQAPFLPITEKCMRPSVVGRMRGCS